MTIELDGIDSVVDDLIKFPSALDKSLSRAMNKQAGKAATATSKATRSVWSGIRARDFKRHTWRKNATINNLATQYAIVSVPINLIDFRLPTSRQSKSGVAYKLQKRSTLKGSFFAKNKVYRRNPKEQVVNKKGQTVDSIIPYYSVTPTFMMQSVDGVDVYTDVYFNDLASTFTKNLKHILSTS